jgi:hypothetical protein
VPVRRTAVERLDVPSDEIDLDAWLFELSDAVRDEASCFTSFYLDSLTRGIPQALETQTWPRITRFADRWRWIVTSIVPRFRRFDAGPRLVDASLRLA